ncbi:spore germination protein [Paenibacillus silviterrae]|uniref:spore germination protein n=1 Tax=Paenibacillus silviterrae TaxID=3242194 RepID=UPI002542E7B0|nr:spore germination protein [Paenibacillus chinjuensis]
MERWDEQRLRNFFAQSSDVQIHHHQLGESGRLHSVVLLYCEGMADTEQLNEHVLPSLNIMLSEQEPGLLAETLSQNQLQLAALPFSPFQDAVIRIYSGHLLLLFEKEQLLYSLDIAKLPQRTPEESSTEVSVKGPRDAFTEELAINTALIRKRIRSNSLCNESFQIGRRSNTRVSLMYIADVSDAAIVEEARSRLRRVDVDALLGSSQLEEMLADTKYPLFPLFDYIGRPDFVAQSLLRGRLVILVDGSPMVLIGPTNLTAILKSPEDMYLPFYFVSLERLLRLIGLLIAILLPGFWVALTSFHMDQLPFPLLATITSSKLGLPMSGSLDLYFMLGLFELFREAGLRLPRAVGQTVAVVGGLIVGDAAIQAGVTSPTTLVVSALTAVSSFTLVNQSLNGTVTVLRFFILACASALGMYGFFLGIFATVLYLSVQRSFGVSYLAPISPPFWKEWPQALLQLPLRLQPKIPAFLRSKKPNR